MTGVNWYSGVSVLAALLVVGCQQADTAAGGRPVSADSAGAPSAADGDGDSVEGTESARASAAAKRGVKAPSGGLKIRFDDSDDAGGMAAFGATEGSMHFRLANGEIGAYGLRWNEAAGHYVVSPIAAGESGEVIESDPVGSLTLQPLDGDEGFSFVARLGERTLTGQLTPL